MVGDAVPDLVGQTVVVRRGDGQDRRGRVPGCAELVGVPVQLSPAVEEAPLPAVAARQGVLPLLEHLVRMGRRAYENAMAPGGLRPRHLIALRLLDERGPQSRQGLSGALSLIRAMSSGFSTSSRNGT